MIISFVNAQILNPAAYFFLVCVLVYVRVHEVYQFHHVNSRDYCIHNYNINSTRAYAVPPLFMKTSMWWDSNGKMEACHSLI